MKRIIPAVLAIALAATLVAVGGPSADADHRPNAWAGHNPNHKPKPTTTTSSTTTTTTTTPPPECVPGTPITITTGGTYSGCYRSTDPNVAAVTIATDQPVTIDRATIHQKGYGIIDTQNSPWRRERVTITDTTFLQSDPGAFVHHRAVLLGSPYSFVFEHNRLIDTDGIYINASDGAGGSHLVNPVTVRYNYAENIGRYPFPLTSGCCVQFLALNAVRDTPGIQIQWNHVKNVSGISDLEGDVINLYESGGTVASPADASHNLIDGAYPSSPSETSWTGGGINFGDCCGGAGGTLPRPGGHGNNHDNVVVSTTNYGVAANGTDNHAYNNLVVNDRLGSDGVTRYDSVFGAGASSYFSDGTSDSHHNRYNWLRNDTDGQQGCVARPSSLCFDNVQVATTEQQARDEWDAARAAAGVTTGPRPLP